jgi:hypothetical protein
MMNDKLVTQQFEETGIKRHFPEFCSTWLVVPSSKLVEIVIELILTLSLLHDKCVSV